MSRKLAKCPGSQGYYPSLFSRFFYDDFLDFITDNNLPAVNIKETKKGFKIEISAPNFDKDDFNVWVDNNILRITACNEKKNKDKKEDENELHRVFMSSSFSRSFALPESVNIEKIEVEEKRGILTVKLPKDEHTFEKGNKYVEIK